MGRRTKIALIGGGNIGGTLAHIIAARNLGDIVICDINEGLVCGKSLDISQAITINNSDTNIDASTDYKSIKDSDVVVITAGISRKPNMSRDDLLTTNIAVMRSISEALSLYSPNAFVIVVTNPIDIMVYAVHKLSKLHKSKVVGMAGILDTGRFKTFIAQEFNVSVENIDGFVLGGHGDSMVPLIRYTTISGIPISEFLKMGWSTQEKIDKIIERTKNGGGEIVSLLKFSSAYYAPAFAIFEMLESYLLNKRKILPCSAYLDGEYGYNNIYVGVPVIIGDQGVEKIIELPLNENESQLFSKSVESVKSLIDSLDIT
ncbi:malate dehydrogenase [Rickettsia endosymbiont of Cardiosporidium cionae]|uniref:malate dehydrogenase n=1 Tax=Rickettsia endosymbiont of Cardiosporidium cionae TaxID=2777155 RepID=UPI00189590BE|nr:malate dehydrogenase [Rickettsia endosymbiont of Cardiosporidium cionae]KAF8818683.1 malate dehydrogenase [Rickettsia endosymbiont of Cardiosporidium cionae]